MDWYSKKVLSWRVSNSMEANILGSSAESVGDFGFGEFSKGVIQGGLQGLDVPKTVGFSHRQFRFEI